MSSEKGFLAVISPLIFTYNGVDLGTTKGDLVYVHPLMIGKPINLKVSDLSKSQDFISSTAYKSPEFKAIIQGSLPDFIEDFYNFYKDWQAVYLLKAGDLIAVYEIAERTYVILQKVTVDVAQEENSNESEE